MSSPQTLPNQPSIRDSVDVGSRSSTRSNTPAASIPHEVIIQERSETDDRPRASSPHRDSTPSPRPTSRIDSLTWDDIQTDEQGEPYGFLGVTFLALTCKSLGD